MASSAVATPNGVVATPVPSIHHPVGHGDALDVSAQSINVSAKRKREDGNDNASNQSLSSHQHNGNHERSSPIEEEVKSQPIDKKIIDDFYLALSSFDATPSILSRSLPESVADEEHRSKRQKSHDGSTLSIAQKFAQDQYHNLDSMVADIKTSILDQLDELRKGEAPKDLAANDAAIAATITFGQKATALFRRELTYPSSSQSVDAMRILDSTASSLTEASSSTVLSIYGDVPRQRPLYSSLQQPLDNVTHTLKDDNLPRGVKTAKAVPYFFPSPAEKDGKSKTLGELYPAPRNLPSLQPPKAPKSSTKGTHVGWHRPELTEKSKFRAGSYFSQPLSTGRWLDYSNAAPPSKIMTKQRERALSLAGKEPSTTDLQMSEMESLFRGAFSSFAPTKDDSAAMISSGMISQTMWWQRVGRRSFDRLIDHELNGDADDKSARPQLEEAPEIDEKAIEQAIEEWDDSMVDPSLEAACCPKKSDAEKDTDDILQDVSDMIQTLISYQRNRNLALPSPSSQSRYSTDPAQNDMLTNGTPAQPGDEEMATYDTLKAQLLLIVKMLPPYAVARLNSDKLDELNISTKIEVRTDEYQGTMEEDEAAARARAAQAATTSARPAAHRAGSSTASMPYGQQYPSSTRPSMPSAQYYNNAQTPVRANMQRPAQSVPPAYSQRPPSNSGYRPSPNAYPGANYAQQHMGKAQGSYAQPGSYGGTPTAGRPQFQQYPGGYHPMNNSPQPQTRFQQYQPNQQPGQYPPQPYQPQQPPQHQQVGTPQHAPPFNQYQNGPATMPQRTASPHIPHQAAHHQMTPHQGFNHNATPSRQPSFSGQPYMANNASQRYSHPTAGSPQMANQQPNPNNNYHSSVQPHQVQQAMDQARARSEIQKNAQRTNEGARSSISAQGGMPPVNYGAASPSPKPHMNSPAMPQAMPAVNGGGSAPTARES